MILLHHNLEQVRLAQIFKKAYKNYLKLVHMGH